MADQNLPVVMLKGSLSLKLNHLKLAVVPSNENCLKSFYYVYLYTIVFQFTKQSIVTR